MHKIYCLLSVLLLAIGIAYGGNPQQCDYGYLNHNGVIYPSNQHVGQGLQVSIGALYYFGDANSENIPILEDFQTTNLSGNLEVGYLHPLGGRCNLRFTWANGLMRGDNELHNNLQIKKFNSFFSEIDLGMEWYLFANAGLYLYAGVGAIYSYITYDYAKAKGTTQSFCPIVPVEFGYAFRMGYYTALTVAAGAHIAMVDAPTFNIDGYPQTAAQNPQHQAIGSNGNKWIDGYFTFKVGLVYLFK